MVATVFVQTVNKDAEFLRGKLEMRDLFDGHPETMNVAVMVKALTIRPDFLDQSWALFE